MQLPQITRGQQSSRRSGDIGFSDLLQRGTSDKMVAQQQQASIFKLEAQVGPWN